MQTLSVCPSTLEPGYSTYSPRALKDLFDNKIVSHIFNGENPAVQSLEISQVNKTTGKISFSGVQPKFSVVIGDDNKLRYTREGEQGTHILKPQPTGYHLINRQFCMANENLTMQFANKIYGIETASNGLCFFANDFSPAYITKRFDICNHRKLKQEDFAALLEINKNNKGPNYKYDAVSYEECAEVISRYVKVAPIDLRRFFKIIIFNFLVLNDDAHVKNFSLIERGGEYRLSPAYDLINTNLHLYEPQVFALEKGLFKEGMKLTDSRWLKRSDFEEFGRRIGLSHKVVKKDLDFFSTPQPEAEKLIKRSFLSEELKNSYFRSYDFRRKSLSF